MLISDSLDIDIYTILLNVPLILPFQIVIGVMSSNDVRDILNLGASSSLKSAGGGTERSNKRHTSAVRKPDGISRELYALIGDNSPYLAETQASLAATKYRERPQLKSKRSKWCANPDTEIDSTLY